MHHRTFVVFDSAILHEKFRHFQGCQIRCPIAQKLCIGSSRIAQKKQKTLQFT